MQAFRFVRPTSVFLVRSRGFSSAAESGKIGFLGLGNMGGYMAKNLVKAGREVVVFDLNQSMLKSVTESGAKAAASQADVSKEARVIVTMLPSLAAVRGVYLSPNGLVANAEPGDLFIDCSTVDPATAKAVAEACAEKGCDMIDAPVSGGTMGAENATLTFMVGGSDKAFKSAEHILKLMGKKSVHCGEVGSGTAAKLCNNLVLGIQMAGVCEGHALADRLGLDQKKFAEIMNTSTGRSWSSEVCNPCPGVMEGTPASRDYTGGFGCDLMIKDLGLATSAAHASKEKLGLPMGTLALQLYSMMSMNGRGDRDFSGLYKLLVEGANKKK
mmetsp:Transcript_95362/g.199509  ORF Transcript_95362/g.199509 Transcript_95362/m.199509 type:complete len:328 (+) Transcript_95362:85-1068(+)|eukprot:CAMPEP_0206451592 /NCGR_PEP_ID=MMETSP0324_2-20121206/19435_1 /ASSEMBLY_ACC=CAM_ASM_000836 /TAXON_ID=2866 /ORGANISM="Crypthecodinium cohnii, Strain Seligo" /LENGTH=327 /DNA_ID=CAMNT_0053921507 /DNA_START=67 /DNA_END=1050 /DNA_ORIENTATION=+